MQCLGPGSRARGAEVAVAGARGAREGVEAVIGAGDVGEGARGAHEGAEAVTGAGDVGEGATGVHEGAKFGEFGEYRRRTFSEERAEG